MLEPIDRQATIRQIQERLCVGCDNHNGALCSSCKCSCCMDIVEDMQAIEFYTDRVAIMRLCNEIEDAVTSIDKMNPSQNAWYELCFIRDKLKEIGKELT